MKNLLLLLVIAATDLGGCPPDEDLLLTGGTFDPCDFDEFSI